MDKPDNQIINPGLVQGQIINNDGTVNMTFVTPGQKTPERVFELPYPRNTLFTGRDDLLAQLHDHLMHMQTAAITQPLAITGLGGIGKTQVAVEYAYRYHDEYRYVLWANASGDITLTEDFVKTARLLHLPEKDEADQTVVVEAVKNWLAQHDGWLLILDNVDDLSVAARYFPPDQRGHILLTTHEASTNPLARGLTVEKMSEADSILFLLQRAGLLAHRAALSQMSGIDRTLAAEIVHEVDGLPLALDQAGAYIAETSSSLADYLAAYRNRQASLLARRGRNSQYPESVATTWNMAFEEIKKSDPIAADLLNVLAFLAPDAIPEEMFIDGASELGTQLQQLADDPTLLNDACATLRRFSLIQRDTTKHQLSIHRLVQTVIQANMPDEEARRQWAECTVRAVDKAFPDVEDVNSWSQCEVYLPHALNCTDLIDRYTIELPESARLLNQAAYYLDDYAQYEQATVLYKRAIIIKQKVYGLNHYSVATTLDNLAANYVRQGKYSQAELKYEQALEIYEQSLGPEHPDTASTLNNLADLYSSQGKYKQAEQLFQRAVAINKNVYGYTHSRTAANLNNLALLYSRQGKYKQAEAMFQEVLAIVEYIFGPNHPNTATSYNNLALLYSRQGNHKEAKSKCEQALRIRENTLGSDHPDTANSLNNLATICQKQGEYEQAEKWYIQSLAIYRRALGIEHPNTLVVQENYRILLELMRKPGEDQAI